MLNTDRRLATLAQALYLTNITIFPVVSFILLILLYLKYRTRLHPTALLHFKQAILANLVAGFLLIMVSLLILYVGEFNSPFTWMTLIIYFLSIHSALILFGVFALIKALAENAYVYPIFGRFWR